MIHTFQVDVSVEADTRADAFHVMLASIKSRIGDADGVVGLVTHDAPGEVSG